MFDVNFKESEWKLLNHPGVGNITHVPDHDQGTKNANQVTLHFHSLKKYTIKQMHIDC